MADGFSDRQQGLSSPASAGAAITPDNSNDLATSTRAIWVGAAGDVKVDLVNGGTVTLVGVPTGTLIPVRAKRVYATGTTASSLVALW